MYAVGCLNVVLLALDIPFALRLPKLAVLNRLKASTKRPNFLSPPSPKNFVERRSNTKVLSPRAEFSETCLPVAGSIYRSLLLPSAFRSVPAVRLYGRALASWTTGDS